MKRILIYVGMLTLLGFALLVQAKQYAVFGELAIDQVEASDTQPRLSSTAEGSIERAAEGSVERAAEGSVERAAEGSIEKTPKLKKQLILDGNAAGNGQEELLAQASFRVKQFSTELKAELIAAIQSGGLNAGVEVCHSKAPKIAERLSTQGWSVARTSLKTRNQENTPDQWETAMLKQFDARFQQGEKAENLVTILSDKNHFRFMKAIPMDQVCLACHGSSIDSNLQKTIQKYYPNDTATGFALEDIRGAFTLQKDLSE